MSVGDPGTRSKLKILLTGASGHVGGRLLPALIKRGHQVRCMTRHKRARKLPENKQVEVVQADVNDASSLRAAADGCHIAYYLIHSMSGRGNFVKADQRAAENFAACAEQVNLQRIIYLGGLGVASDKLSTHLQSRQEVGNILRSSRVPTLEFRAAMVIGAGSLSFETVRNLCNRLPVMLCPKWLSTRTQPIYTGDLINYLTAALDIDLPESRIVEIGSPEVTTYRQILREYARQKGMTRLLIPVPLLTPNLSKWWLQLVTPETSRVSKDLIAGLTNPTLLTDNSADVFALHPVGVGEAIAKALAEKA